MWVGDSASPGNRPGCSLFFGNDCAKWCRKVNTAMAFDDGDPQPLVDNHFPYYVENIVNRGLCLEIQFHRARLGQVCHPMGGIRSARVCLRARFIVLDDPAHGLVQRADQNAPNRPQKRAATNRSRTIFATNFPRPIQQIRLIMTFSPLSLLKRFSATGCAVEHTTIWPRSTPSGKRNSLPGTTLNHSAPTRSKIEWQAATLLRAANRTGRQLKR